MSTEPSGRRRARYALIGAVTGALIATAAEAPLPIDLRAVGATALIGAALGASFGHRLWELILDIMFS